MRTPFPLSKALFSILFLFLSINVIGQERYSLPNVITPSPQSLAFTRYGDYPMAAYNGLTDITIPLHNVTGRKLTLPMSMSFHASGRMANEINGILGMRWTLNCGGLVTRTMKGAPDEWTNLTPYVVDPSHEPSFDELYGACPDGKISGIGPFYDTEFDIFSYALPNGKQGHFILKNKNGKKEPMLIPYAPLKIALEPSAYGNGYFDRVIITDDDGTRYTFGTLTGADNAIETAPAPDGQSTLIGQIPTAWYLRKITSSDGTDEISFYYHTRYENVQTAAQHAKIYDQRRSSTTLYELSDCIPYAIDPYECDMMSRLGPKYYWDQSPDQQFEIYTNTRIVPTLNAIQFSGGSVSLNYINDFLNEIIVNRGAVPYKKIKFNYTNAGDVLTHLDNLAFYGEDLSSINEKYSFGYYDGQSFVDPQAAGRKDWWGNYYHLNINLLPWRPGEMVNYLSNFGGTQNVGFQTTNREGDPRDKIMGMLKMITYPTGGQTEFIYEANFYNYGYGPGLRISEVISNPVIGPPIHKIYRYGNNESGYGVINRFIKPGSPYRNELTILESNAMHFWSYNNGWIDQQMGFRMRDYLSDPYVTFDFEGSPIKYDVVTEYVDGDQKQKTQSFYSWGDDAELSDFIVHDNERINYPRKYSDPKYASLTPVMTGRITYKYTNRQFEPVKKETFDYGFEQKEDAWDMPTYAHTSIVWARTPWGSDQYNAAKNYHNSDCSVYGYGYRNYRSGSQLLYRTTIEEYTPAGTFVTQKDQDYELSNHYLRLEKLTNSKNEQLITTYTYPKDLEAFSPYNEMVNRNIVKPVIEQVNTNATLNKELARSKTNYSFWQGNTIIAPATIQKSILGNPLETEATINEYDNVGNILQVTGKDGIITSYVWGYDQKYPVAKVVGSPYYDAVAISGIDLAVINSGSGTISTELNKLRGLSSCLVSTYTYKPLTGMTSETDPNGRTIYYEYDVFGRLVLTRDKDNNILKKYAYDYQGQCTTCGAMSNANWQPTGLTRHIPCEVNPAFYSLLGQREEKDINPTSSTYNQSRWFDYYIQYNDPLYDVSAHVQNAQYWVNTSTSRCIQYNGQNTGELEQDQVYLDPNPCHEAQNSHHWVNTGMNTNACPMPSVFKSGEIRLDFKSSVCVSPAEPDPIPVFVPEGMFTSTLSGLDADNQAWDYAQRYADEHGTCTVPPIDFTFINNHGGGFTVSLYDDMGNEYTMYSSNGSNAYYHNLPQGVYHVYISPAFSDEWIGYEMGCKTYPADRGDVFFYDVPINAGCNTITAN